MAYRRPLRMPVKFDLKWESLQKLEILVPVAQHRLIVETVYSRRPIFPPQVVAFRIVANDLWWTGDRAWQE